MADLPTASVTIDDEAGAFGGGTGYVVVVGCVERNADVTPRVFGSAKSFLAQHGYGAAADYVAIHLEATKKPVVFVGLPTATAGTVLRSADASVGTSTISVAAGTSGILEELDGLVTVVTGGTIGVNGITFNLSLDGGRTVKLIRLGTANSYVVPYVGVALAFAAGTLLAGDRFTFATTPPLWDGAGLTAARLALAAQQKTARSILVVGDLPNSTFAGHVTTAVNAYETANDRFVYARAQVRDRRIGKLTGAPSLTFAEVGASGDTITRATGSWITDGYAVGDTITIFGTSSNNVVGVIGALSATVLTLTTADLTPETIASSSVTVGGGETMAAWIAAVDADFASVDSQRRIDLGAGRLRKMSPITEWEFRRPVQWAASVREYQHDVQIPVWRKTDGPLDGWSMEDADGNAIVEFDERTDAGGLAGRFTCARTYSNGPLGAFVGLSLTRAVEGSLLSRTHNLAVANLACTVTQAETENAIGQVLVLDDSGRGTDASLQIIEGRVNTGLQMALLQQRAEGPRASSAVWRASRTDILNVPAAELTGVLDLRLNGTLERITTTVKIQTAG